MTVRVVHAPWVEEWLAKHDSDAQLRCKECGKPFTPTRAEGAKYRSRIYCTPDCRKARAARMSRRAYHAARRAQI